MTANSAAAGVLFLRTILNRISDLESADRHAERRGQQRYAPTIGAAAGDTRYRDGGRRYATSGRIWLVNQRRIVRNEPPHSPEFNARTWTLACVRARGLLNMRRTGKGVAGRRGFSDFPLRLPGRSATARDRRDGHYVFVNSNSISIRAGDPRAFVSTRRVERNLRSRFREN